MEGEWGRGGRAIVGGKMVCECGVIWKGEGGAAIKGSSKGEEGGREGGSQIERQREKEGRTDRQTDR